MADLNTQKSEIKEEEHVVSTAEVRTESRSYIDEMQLTLTMFVGFWGRWIPTRFE